MRQVPLGLVPPAAPPFDNFVPGANADTVAQLRDWVRAPSAVFLWGEAGCGKSHLLAALMQALAPTAALRRRLVCVDARATGAWEVDANTPLVVLDDVDRLDAAQQHRALALLVQAQAHGVPWAAAAPCPPVDLPLREDLRSRLGWGLVFAIAPLSEAQTREVLHSEASRRGIRLGDDLLDHLMHRCARDLGFLMRLFEALDAYALSQSRPVTVPLLRRLLAESGDGLKAPPCQATGPTDHATDSF